MGFSKYQETVLLELEMILSTLQQIKMNLDQSIALLELPHAHLDPSDDYRLVIRANISTVGNILQVLEEV